MLINVLQSEECRIAIVEDRVLEELYVERSSQESYVGNIYKGRIVNIEPSIQAAFVDFGIGRNGFLHVSDVDPAYYKHLLSKEDLEEYEADQDREYGGGSSARGRDRGDRGSRDRGPRPQPMTSWLEPQPPRMAMIPTPPTPPTPPTAPIPESGRNASVEDVEDVEDTEGFAEGLDEVPMAEEIFETVVEAMEESPAELPITPPIRPQTTEPEEIDQEFGAGLVEAAPAPHQTPVSLPSPAVRTPRVKIIPKPVIAEPTDDDDFGAGIVNET
ncbi:MAG TPA: hypothetical protein VG122_22465, partial [Gemmata sp.]|nr:hypothetical protein [Gemmata sp.]